MNISRISNVICENIDTTQQELLNSYVSSTDKVRFVGFSNYCQANGVAITEDMMEEILADNTTYLFTESEDGWVPTKLHEIDNIIGDMLVENVNATDKLSKS